MLKIKDNIDLKELEKFGFKYIKKNYNTREHYSLSKKVSRLTTELYAWVDCKNRSIYKGTWTEDSLYADILFDLIQAGLVEKVEEKAMKIETEVEQALKRLKGKDE